MNDYVDDGLLPERNHFVRGADVQLDQHLIETAVAADAVGGGVVAVVVAAAAAAEVVDDVDIAAAEVVGVSAWLLFSVVSPTEVLTCSMKSCWWCWTASYRFPFPWYYCLSFLD